MPMLIFPKFQAIDVLLIWYKLSEIWVFSNCEVPARKENVRCMRSSNAKLEYVVEVFGLSWISTRNFIIERQLSIYLFLFIDDIDADKVGKGILGLSSLLFPCLLNGMIGVQQRDLSKFWAISTKTGDRGWREKICLLPFNFKINLSLKKSLLSMAESKKNSSNLPLTFPMFKIRRLEYCEWYLFPRGILY